MEDHTSSSSSSSSSTVFLSVVVPSAVTEERLVVEKELCRGGRARKRHRPSSSSSSSIDNNDDDDDDDDNQESIVAVSSLEYHDAAVTVAHTMAAMTSDADNGCTSSSVDDQHQSDEEIIVPRFNNYNNDYNVIIEAYKKYQAIYLPRYENKNKNGAAEEENDNIQWKDLSEIYKNLNSEDKESFCIENNNNNNNSSELFEEERNKEDKNENNPADSSSSSSSFMTYNNESDNNNNNNSNNIGYCSFLIQNDKIALSNILRRLPVRDPLFNNKNVEYDDDDDLNKDDHYEPCLWVFFGRNNSNNNNNNRNDLQGRPEHTDQISHDGTWHYQLSGTKRWLLRPTPTLLRQFKKEQREQQQQQQNGGTEEDNQEKDENEQEEPKQIRIDCQEGDILIVNTRLWKHQTIIPSQIPPSVSYARDFWTSRSQISSNNNKKKKKKGEGEGTTATTKMTNVDGVYATDDVESDTIIFKENDMPDCELHTSSSTDVANCKVVELDDGHGTQAVVSSRYITAGEFFCIIESDSSSSDDDEDVNDDDDDDDDEDNDNDNDDNGDYDDDDDNDG